MQTVLILMGGRSVEHAVSLRSAGNVLSALDRNRFTPVPVLISEAGEWYTGEVAAVVGGDTAQLSRVQFDFHAGVLVTDAGSVKPDVVFPLIHGAQGEDGTLAGLFTLAGLPYVGPEVAALALTYDKDLTKRVLRDAGVSVVPWQLATVPGELSYARCSAALSSTLFVKPARAGSSVGVARVNDQASFDHAVAAALQFDTKVLIEAAVVGRELECAVLGNQGAARASVVGEVVVRSGDFYSYDEKYAASSSAETRIPAALTPAEATLVRETALSAYTALGCEGMTRVDLFLATDGTVYVNEVNTIPGFTDISMYPKLWEASGLSYQALISELIELALARAARQATLRTTYDR